MAAKPLFPYVVSLQASQVKIVQWIGALACLCSAGTFLYAYFIDINHRHVFWLISALCVFLAVGWNLFQMYHQRKPQPYRYALLLAAITWLSMPYARWISLLLLGMFLLEATAIRRTEIGFGQDYILVNGLIPKKIYWQELSQVILKDNLLTLDYLDNRIWQKEIMDDDEPDAGEDEFNTFCQHQLSQHASKKS